MLLLISPNLMEFLSDFSPMQNEQEVKSGTFTKAVQLKGKTVAFEVFDNGTVENPKLEFTAYCRSQDSLTKSRSWLLTG